MSLLAIGWPARRAWCGAVTLAMLCWSPPGTPQSGPFWLSDSAKTRIVEWRSGVIAEDQGYLLLGSGWDANKQVFQSGETPPLHIRVVRLSKDGRLLWLRDYGRYPRLRPHAVSLSGDGGSCALASVFNHRLKGEGRLWLLKLDREGRQVWEIHPDGIYESSGLVERDYETFGVAATSEGGCVIAGATATESTNEIQVRVVSVSAQGKVLWDRAFGPKPFSMGISIAAVPDGFLVAGSTGDRTGRSSDALLLKLSRVGAVLGENRYGTPDAGEIAYQVLPLADGGALLTGMRLEAPERRTAWVARIDRDARQVWVRSFAGTSSHFFLGANQTAPGQFELLGVSSRPGDESHHRALVVVVDTAGKRVRHNAFEHAMGQLTQIVRSPDGGYLLLGAPFYDLGLVKLDRDGKQATR